MTDRPATSVLEGGALTREQFRDQFLGPLNDFVAQLTGAAAESELTIASGTVTPTGHAHIIDTESDAASDDLTHLQVTNLPAGSIVQLRAVDAARVPTLKHGSGGSGQLLLQGSADVVLSDITRRIWLQRVGTDWVEIDRARTADLIPANLALTGVISPAQITGDQNNYSPTGLATASTLRINADAARTVTGLAGGATGRVLIIENVGAHTITLADQSASSTAANRFLFGADLAIPADRSVILRYDGTTTRWRLAARTDVLAYGLHMIPLPAAAWAPAQTNGCDPLETNETTAGRSDIDALWFDAGADEHAQCRFPTPTSWDGGGLYARVWWTTNATDTDGVAWALRALAVGSGESFDQAFGTAVVGTDDAESAAEDGLRTALIGPITAANAPAGGKFLCLDIYRDVSDGNDDMTEPAGLVGVELYMRLNKGNDE